MSEIVILESYYGGSHKCWVDNFVQFSTHEIKAITMDSVHWKWRMHGAAYYFVSRLVKLELRPKLLICSSLIDVSSLRSQLSMHFDYVPKILLYMHENQLTYPFSNNEIRHKEDFTYGFINIRSCIDADYVVFNSYYHKNQFSEAANELIERLPDYRLCYFREKSQAFDVLPVGFNYSEIKVLSTSNCFHSPIRLLWNHRWDHDKNPRQFYDFCLKLKQKGQDFELILLGSKGNSNIRDLLIREFPGRIAFSGYAKSKEEYNFWLNEADIAPVTSDHDFYGISVMEAIAWGAYPLLPRGKVYEEYFSLDDHIHHYYDGTDQLVTKFDEAIASGQNNFKFHDELMVHDIYTVMETNDKYISDVLI